MYSFLQKIFSKSMTGLHFFIGKKIINPVVMPTKLLISNDFDLKKSLSNKTYYFISLCLRVLQLPMIFVCNYLISG